MTGSRPEAADATPDELVRRAARGDLAAFARIVRLHHENMTRVAFVITGDSDTAAEAANAAWPVAWDELRRNRVPEDLGSWLCSLAATEASFAATLVGPAWDPVPALAGGSSDAGLEQALARLDPADRALLALRHVAGFSVVDLTRLHRRSRPPVVARMERATVIIGGPQPPGAETAVAETARSDPAAAQRRVGERLLAYATIPVRPVDADATARRARAGAAPDLTRVASVAISVVIGGLVAGLPYLAMFFHGR